MSHSPSKTIIVSGASSGIGSAVALWLAHKGANLMLTARRTERLEHLAEALRKEGARVVIHSGDISQPKTSAEVVDKTLSEFGTIQALINNAGTVMPLARLADLTTAAWQNSLAVNLSGPFYLISAAMAALRKSRGRIINVSSGAAQHAIAGAAVYCTAKAGLNQMTHVLAEEEPTLTCVAVRPGVVDTPMQTLLRRQGPQNMPADHARYYQELKSQNKLLHPARPARAIAWLALKAPLGLSGRFMNHDDPEIRYPARLTMGPVAPIENVYDHLTFNYQTESEPGNSP